MNKSQMEPCCNGLARAYPACCPLPAGTGSSPDWIRGYKSWKTSQIKIGIFEATILDITKMDRMKTF